MEGLLTRARATATRWRWPPESYVNAVVAVALGWLFYREPFGWRETGAMVIIFAGVAVVKRYSAKPEARVLPASRR